MARFKNITTGVEVEQEGRNPQDLANQGFTPISNAIPLSGFETATPTNFKTPTETPIYPIEKLDTTIPKLEMTQPEKVESDYRRRLAEINKQLIGESEYRTEQEEAQKLPELIKTQTDLSNQLKMIQAEAQQIPLQLQQEATGRGITAGGLAPLQTARLRTNTIRALGVSALLQASQGNITTAQNLVDRAVAAKFDPIKEERTVLKDNLQLIIDSPEYSLADKNRAKKQLEAQTAIEEREAKAEADQKTIWDLSVQAAETGANAQVLQAIQNAKTPEEAMQLASQAGVFITEEEKSLIMEGYTKLSGPSQLQGLTEADILRMPNGDIYKRPEEAIETTITPTARGGGISPVGKPLSTNQIEQFRRSYGWTPPYGFSQEQLLQYIADNPGATPEELEAGAKQAIGEVETVTPEETKTEQFLSEDYIRNNFSKDELKSLADKFGASKWYTSASADINRFIKQINTKIEEARRQGVPDQEILDYIKA